MGVHKAWNLKYNTKEMTAATNENYIECNLKIAVWWGRSETFDSERFKSITGSFSDGGNEKFFGCWVGFFPIPIFTQKGSEKGETVHTWWVQHFCDIFGKKGDVWHMILGDNPAGHGFVLRDLISLS